MTSGCAPLHCKSFRIKSQIGWSVSSPFQAPQAGDIASPLNPTRESGAEMQQGGVHHRDCAIESLADFSACIEADLLCHCLISVPFPAVYILDITPKCSFRPLPRIFMLDIKLV